MSRILVIDDDPNIRAVVKTYLTLGGDDVDTAENGKIGLMLAGLHQYDLVVTDIVMPERDGFEVIMQLRRTSPSVRIIGMSGGVVKLDKADLLNSAKLMGADRVLPKPLDFIELQATVKEVLAMV